MFVHALERATMIEVAGSELILSSDDSSLRFVPVEQPDTRGDLPLTAAGETLLIEPADGQLTSVFTISLSPGDSGKIIQADMPLTS